ncbi:MAG TPA: hypothetical protein VGO86_16340, partial [Candidatus Dormibacteraeota bacterium]
VGHLVSAGYSGWYALEQDTALDAEPATGGGPALDVRRSMAFVHSLSGRSSGMREEREDDGDE